MINQIPAALFVLAVASAALEDRATSGRRWHPLMSLTFTLGVSVGLWGLIFWAIFEIVGFI